MVICRFCGGRREESDLRRSQSRGTVLVMLCALLEKKTINMPAAQTLYEGCVRLRKRICKSHFHEAALHIGEMVTKRCSGFDVEDLQDLFTVPPRVMREIVDRFEPYRDEIDPGIPLTSYKLASFHRDFSRFKMDAFLEYWGKTDSDQGDIVGVAVDSDEGHEASVSQPDTQYITFPNDDNSDTAMFSCVKEEIQDPDLLLAEDGHEVEPISASSLLETSTGTDDDLDHSVDSREANSSPGLPAESLLGCSSCAKLHSRMAELQNIVKKLNDRVMELENAQMLQKLVKKEDQISQTFSNTVNSEMR
ncbi:hypothetical protein V3C99_000179 [Haemonchus contortus]|nr:unnamed protein product [Haemonchus contortus]